MAPKKAKASGPVASLQLPKGQVLTDLRKRSWKVGSPIGRGGFGEIYLAEDASQCPRDVPSSAHYVIKIEPFGNGPLFSEINFYTRCAKKETIDGFVASHKVSHLGMPQYIAHGQHVFKGEQYRFMVMQRFYGDLDSKFVDNCRVFPRETVCRLAISVLNVLEYLHSLSYVHADIKGSNILLSSTKEEEVCIVDFGLAALFTIDGDHRAYKKDPKCAHDGTIEFTSRDAHDGVRPSRRSDVEILGYVLLQWLCSRLPWEGSLANKPEVARQKARYMGDIKSLMKDCFGTKPVPAEIQAYLTAVAGLKYDEKPQYEKLRRLFTDAMRKNGWSDRGKLAWGAAAGISGGRKRRSADVSPDDEPELQQPRRKRPAKASTVSPDRGAAAAPTAKRPQAKAAAGGRKQAALAAAALSPAGKVCRQAPTVGQTSPAPAPVACAAKASPKAASRSPKRAVASHSPKRATAATKRVAAAPAARARPTKRTKATTPANDIIPQAARPPLHIKA